MAKADQYSRHQSIKVKARYNYTCAICGSLENIQAHAPGGDHTDWRKGMALCGDCHAKEHPNVPVGLFSSKGHQPYWPNISASALAKEFGCHNRTVIRHAKILGIPIGIALSQEDKLRLQYEEIKQPRKRKIEMLITRDTLCPNCNWKWQPTKRSTKCPRCKVQYDILTVKGIDK